MPSTHRHLEVIEPRHATTKFLLHGVTKKFSSGFATAICWHCPGDLGHFRDDPCRHGNRGHHYDSCHCPGELGHFRDDPCRHGNPVHHRLEDGDGDGSCCITHCWCWSSTVIFAIDPIPAPTALELSLCLASASVLRDRNRHASEMSIRHSRCIQVLLQSSSRSDTYADVQMKLGPGASQSLTSRTSPWVSRGATISLSESHSSVRMLQTRQSLEPRQSRFHGPTSDSELSVGTAMCSYITLSPNGN